MGDHDQHQPLSRWTPPAHPLPPAPRKTGTRIAAIGAGFTVLVILGIVHTVTHNDAPHPVAATTTPAVVAPAAPSPTLDANAAKMVSWWRSGGQDDDDAILSAETAMTTASGAGDVAATGAACSDLAAAARTAGSEQPPVASVATPWEQAMTEYQIGGRECADGAKVGDGAEIETGAADIKSGTDALSQVTAAIKVIAAGG